MVGTRRSAAGPANRLRAVLLLAITCDVHMVCLRVVLYQPFLQQHDALVYIVEPVVLLLTYAAIALITTMRPTSQRHGAARIGVAIGIVSGAMWVGNLSLETFSAAAGILATAPFLLGAFLLWGMAGFLAARQTGSLVHGLCAAQRSDWRGTRVGHRRPGGYPGGPRHAGATLARTVSCLSALLIGERSGGNLAQ